jgi:hypothetical protein
VVIVKTFQSLGRPLFICACIGLASTGCSPHADPKATEFVHSFAQALSKGDLSAAYQMCTADFRARVDKEELAAMFDMDGLHGKGVPTLGETKFLGDPKYDSVLYIDKGENQIGWFSQKVTPGGAASPIELKIHVCEESGKFLVDG